MQWFCVSGPTAAPNHRNQEMEFIGQCIYGDMKMNKNDSTDWQEILFLKKSLEAETQHQRG